MTQLETEIRSLVSRYGYKKVREGLEKEMRETYEYLREIYGNQETGNEKISKKHSKNTGDSNEKLETSKTGKVSRKSLEKTGDSKVPGSLEKSGETGKVPATLETGEVPGKTGESQEVPGKPVEIREDTGEKTVVLTNIPDRQENRNVVIIEKIDGTEESSIGHEEIGNKVWPFKKSGNVSKSKLKEDIEKRKEELKAENKSSRTMMTKDNLEKWLSEGDTYVAIAKRVGLTPNTVIKYAEKYDLEKSKTVKSVNENKESTNESKEYLSPDEIKRRKEDHSAKIAAKRKEFLDAGKKPEEQLNKYQLKQWREKGWTTWKIAEETGCTEYFINKIEKE